MKRRPFLLAILTCLLCFFSCQKDNDLTPTVEPPTANSSIIESFRITNNPNGVAPLTALLQLETNQEVVIQMRVIGLNGAASDVIRDFSEVGTSFRLPVIGLYPEHNNQVELTFFNGSGTKIGSETISIQTTRLIADLPQISIDKYNTDATTPGWNLVNYFGHNGNIFPQRPFMFDEFGDIRWYFDFSRHPNLNNLFFDNGMNRLQNGNFIFGDKNANTIYELNLMGEFVNQWNLVGYGFHHTVIEKQDGNLLITVNDLSKETVEDVIIELGRQTKSVTNTWDLNESLDNGRTTWDSDITDIQKDWFHANSLYHDPQDNTILVSGRTQGVVKLTETNEVIWMLAPHKDWEQNGNGEDLTSFLLQPIDANDQPITDPQVLNGTTNHPDFEWAWYQHAAIYLPNGNLLLFDNGENRNYSQAEKYSRAVEYEIDDTNKTIKQVWTYGKERGASAYSRIVSRVEYHESTDNVLFTPGAILFEGQNYGKVIEIDRQSDEVVFEATITPPQANFNITFHNVQRMPLFGN